jgi:hypothetical protein
LWQVVIAQYGAPLILGQCLIKVGLAPYAVMADLQAAMTQ